MMDEQIRCLIQDFIHGQSRFQTAWRRPVVGFADADDPLFENLKTVVAVTHAMPRDFLAQAETVGAFFLPYEPGVGKSNRKGDASSELWARAYIETNQVIHEINQHLQDWFRGQGYDSSIIPATHNFDKELLRSDWSHRHVAYICGLGTFGVNNMLITEQGCGGRIGTFVTDCVIESTPRPAREYCLYKIDGTCGVCIGRCVNGALTKDGFDRYRCYEMCLKNAKAYESLGKADVCGKCVVGIPCALQIPKNGQNR